MNMKTNIYDDCLLNFTDIDYGSGSLEGRIFKLVWSSNPNINQESILSYFHIDKPNDRNYYDSNLYNETLWIEFCSKKETKIIIEIIYKGNKERSFFGFDSNACYCLCNLSTLEFVLKKIQKEPDWNIVNLRTNKENEDIYLSFFRKNGIEPKYRNKTFEDFLDYYEVNHDLVNRSSRTPEVYAKEIRFMFWNKNFANLTAELKVDLFKTLMQIEIQQFFEYVKSA